MQSVQESIQFLEAIRDTCTLIDFDDMLNGAIEHLELLKRRHVQNPTSYLLEVSKEDFVAWLLFREQRTLIPPKAAIKVLTEKT